MLFNSHAYLFLFLPLTLIFYFLISLRDRSAARIWLVVASLGFYAWWRAEYLWVLVVSALVNYGIGTWLTRHAEENLFRRKSALAVGLVWNIALLGYFKYAGFLIENVNYLFGSEVPAFSIVLPLAISFFTFQKIAYLVDCYHSNAPDYGLAKYLLFVSFFPQLIAGPIVHHKEILDQFEQPSRYRFHWENFALGLTTLVLGLAKKLLIADYLAVWANHGFDSPVSLNVVQAWAAALAYTFQLYFDFSGYTDMAIGSALMFNVVLPENFRSPYRSTDISDFWRRWHMTLGRFLRDYVYIPLGGNRGSAIVRTRNVVLTFLIGGIWHGAAWTFLFWGAWHGMGVALHSIWKERGHKLPPLFGWLLTMLFVVVGWVFFRAKSWNAAIEIIGAMAGLHSTELSFKNSLKLLGVETHNTLEMLSTLLLLGIASFVAYWGKNVSTIRAALRPTWPTALVVGTLFILSMIHLHRVQEFLYFNF